MKVTNNTSSKNTSNESTELFIDLLNTSNPISVADAYEQRVYRAGEIIIEEGNVATGAFLILEGCVNGVKILDTKLKHRAKLRGKGEVFGFVPFLEGNRENNMTFIASTDVKVLFIPANTFTAIIHNSPAIRQFLLGIFYQEIHLLKTSLKCKISTN